MLSLHELTQSNPTSDPPEHHVISAPISLAASGWASYIPSWAPSPKRARPSWSKGKTAGFRNPWPSWHKPTPSEMWESFQWGEADDGCAELAASHLANEPVPPKPERSKRPSFNDIDDWPNSLGAQATRLLRIEDPDFSFPEDTKAKATWLGHAGVLVQLPSLDRQSNRPVRCLFDPMFSARCSPSQFAGPIRSYPPPCKIEDLPPIDIVCISHNHYDHMDQPSITSVWRHSEVTARFFVPLGNKRYLLDWKIPADRIVEMDWWGSAELAPPSPTPTTSTLKVHCTPAQHNSFRSAGDADSALWSSWTLELLPSATSAGENSKPFRVFFAGDTGYQFHPSPAWPPSPNNPITTPEDENNDTKFPACPAFAEIRSRIGPPNLLLLPVSVGATYAYLRSFVPLPDSINPFPRHTAGVTAANHMPPWDAVRVMKVMTYDEKDGEGREDGERPVAVAMHWGTFVTDPGEVLRTLGALEWACRRQGVRFGRGLGKEKGREPEFVAVNHGGSVCL